MYGSVTGDGGNTSQRAKFAYRAPEPRVGFCGACGAELEAEDGADLCEDCEASVCPKCSGLNTSIRGVDNDAGDQGASWRECEDCGETWDD